MENKKTKPPIICFAGCDWWYHNRGLFVAQVMRRFARNRKVLFVNSLGMRVPSLSTDTDIINKILRKTGSFLRYLKKDESGMYIFTPFYLPLKSVAGKTLMQQLLRFQLHCVSKILAMSMPVYYIGCPPAYEVVSKLPRHFLIYEKTDIFEEMPGADRGYISELDRMLTVASDLVLYANKALWEQDSDLNKNRLLIGHGVDYERFANVNLEDHAPEDIAVVPRPIVGYFGDVTEDVCDFQLIDYTAKALPHVSFVFVGPLSADVTELKLNRNIYFLGQKPYEQIPHYGKMFDVAIMPWKQNRWIEFCNPIKTKEYLALGKPIVSIDYPELRPFYDLVYPARNKDEFVVSIKKALSETSISLSQQRRESVRLETWDNKVEQIDHYLYKSGIR